MVDDVQALLCCNLDLRIDLKKKDKELKVVEDSRKRAEGAHKEAKELAVKNAKKLEDSRATLLPCMQEAKVALDVVFAKGSMKPSEVLPDADPMEFLAWLQAEHGQFTQLLNNVLDFGAYGATLAIAWSFQTTGCDHLKKLGRVNNSFPSVDDVRGASSDRLCKNIVTRYLMKFWMEGRGRALAFSEAVSSTHEVY